MSKNQIIFEENIRNTNSHFLDHCDPEIDFVHNPIARRRKKPQTHKTRENNTFQIKATFLRHLVYSFVVFAHDNQAYEITFFVFILFTAGASFLNLDC